MMYIWNTETVVVVSYFKCIDFPAYFEANKNEFPFALRYGEEWHTRGATAS